jgi:putative hydrolase of the HAD superfamily
MMNQAIYIFFDCMETIVDLYELPNQSDYALWTFSDSEVEHYWSGFNEFLEKYDYSRKEMMSLIEANQEYEIINRIEMLVDRTESININYKHQITRRLYDNYWKTYKSKCYIKEEIKYVLSQLAKQYKLAVVSNFMVKDGIEELLKENGLRNRFEFVNTSINIGWRKPDPKIYEFSIQCAGCNPDQIIFVGDDYENDYLAPRRLGMKSIFLDKEGKTSTEIDKVIDFYELRNKLLG